MAEKRVKLNEKEITLQELEEKILEAKEQKGIKIKKIKEGEYRIKIEG